MPRARFGTALVIAWLALGAVARPCAAQAADDATRAAARSLGYEGIGDFQAGNFAAAAEKLDRAYRALRVPSLGLWSARALEKSGKLVGAAERYLEVQRLDPTTGGEVDVQKQAQADAASEHAALLPRIPSVVIRVEGAPAHEVGVTVDGTAVPNSLIGVKRPIDPGPSKIEGLHAGRRVTEAATVKEGETRAVTLRFDPLPSALPALPAATPTAGSASEGAPPRPGAAPGSAPRDDGAPAASGSALRTVGFIALGVGGAGIAAGAVTGGLAMSKRDSLEGCRGTRCPPSQRAEVDSYNGLRLVSGASFIGGGALAATGLVLLLAAPSSKPSTSAGTGPRLGVTPWTFGDGAGLIVEVER